MAAINNKFFNRKVIITLSTKGGVGKTTDALHIGYQLKKKHDLKFQYIDADVQESGVNHCHNRANLLSDCGIVDKEENETGKLVIDCGNEPESQNERARPIPEEIKRLVKRLFKYSKPYVLPNVIKKKGFASHIDELKNHYDGFIIDTQGADTTGGRAALVSADIVVVPVNPSGLVISELHKVIEMFMFAKPLNPEAQIFIVFNRVVSSAKKIAREHIQGVNAIVEKYLAEEHDTTSKEAMIHVCETVITERQEVYNNVDVGLNAFELSKGKIVDAEMQFDQLLDEIEYLYNLKFDQQEVA